MKHTVYRTVPYTHFVEDPVGKQMSRVSSQRKEIARELPVCHKCDVALKYGADFKELKRWNAQEMRDNPQPIKFPGKNREGVPVKGYGGHGVQETEERKGKKGPEPLRDIPPVPDKLVPLIPIKLPKLNREVKPLKTIAISEKVENVQAEKSDKGSTKKGKKTS